MYNSLLQTSHLLYCQAVIIDFQTHMVDSVRMRSTAQSKRQHERMSLHAGKFFWYFLFLFLTLLYYSFYGIVTVVISPSVQARTICLTAWRLAKCAMIAHVLCRPRRPAVYGSRAAPPRYTALETQ